MNSCLKPLLAILFPLLVFSNCKKPSVKEEKPTPEMIPVPYVGGTRIAWDYSSLKKISPGTGYNGYARLIETRSGDWLCVYESNGNVVVSKSIDEGQTWQSPIIVESKSNGVNMAVPDILELADGSILVCYNPRPSTPTQRFAIKTKKSYDGGITWRDTRLLYEADYYFENGCWEPAAIQLPDGTIQLYFANEGVFLSSNEQNISMLRSNDNGLTWTTTPEVISYRAGARDGMPVPLLLKNKKDIVVAIEDNGFSNFKPYTIRNSLTENWANFVNGTSSNRHYALSNRIAESLYAGAPYIRQLPSGETILSYQGTEERTNNMNNADMKVVIGDSEAKSFGIKSSPFTIPSDKSALWNSISVIGENTVIALTSTNAYSNETEVWMIKGHVISEVITTRSLIAIDGQFAESAWNSPFPLFVGHKGSTRARAITFYNDEFLYILTEVKDNTIHTTSSVSESDGITIYVTTNQQGYEAPVKGTFSISVTADNKLEVREGDAGTWVKRDINSVQTHTTKSSSSYKQEIAIPWSILGGKPAVNGEIALNFGITENSGMQTADYKETITNCIDVRPSTWVKSKIN